MKFFRDRPADLRERLARSLAPDLLFNMGMSREIDRPIFECDHHREIIQRLLDENALLRELVKKLEAERVIAGVS